jgi:uncharacterized ubiquitin-like protein YukD
MPVRNISCQQNAYCDATRDKGTYTLSKEFDLRILKCKTLQRVFDVLLLALSRLDAPNLEPLLLQVSNHSFLFARKKEEKCLAL